jgi:hypothetical protein
MPRLMAGGFVAADGGFRARLARFIPPCYHPAIYAIASGIALAAVVLLWQPSGRQLLVLDGVPRRVAQGVSLIAVSVFVWGIVALRGFDPFGLTPIRAHLSGKQEQPPAFVVRAAHTDGYATRCTSAFSCSPGAVRT